MLDINKWVSQEHAEPALRGHLIELEPWTEEMAIEMARRDGLELSDDHLAIIRYLRDCYADHGGTINARMLMKTLEEEFAGLGGHRFFTACSPADRSRRPVATPVCHCRRGRVTRLSAARTEA